MDRSSSGHSVKTCAMMNIWSARLNKIGCVGCKMNSLVRGKISARYKSVRLASMST